MCTVTFLPRRAGYWLAMNRDERLTRPVALPPQQAEAGDRTVLCPAEPGGGTWIALNDQGICLSLINWYSAPQYLARDVVSRGRVVPSACAADTRHHVESVLRKLPLPRMNPFRLIGVFPTSSEVVEWRWGRGELHRLCHGWQVRQWTSSGLDDRAAQRVRRERWREALGQRSAGTSAWLRRLHRSHAPQRGPFSVCMHRADAATVSFTEICVAPQCAAMRYWPGSPCCARRSSSRELSNVNV